MSSSASSSGGDAGGKDSKVFNKEAKPQAEMKLSDMIDKTRATKEERDGDVAEVEALGLLQGQALSSEESDVYAELTLRHEDIGADNDQIFLIEGDSLLHEILLDPLVDWSHGGQFLHLLYALEHYVQRFQEGGRIFRFVFFHSFGGAAWGLSPFLQLLRERAIVHLREKLHIQVNEFHNWWDEPFHHFLERTDPAFILVGDGSAPGASAGAGKPAAASSSSSSSVAAATAAVPTSDSVNALSRFMSTLSLSAAAPPSAGGAVRSLPPHEIIRSLSLYLLSHHFRVIRLTELSFANNSMYAFQMAMAQAYKKQLRAEGGYKPHPLLMEKSDAAQGASKDGGVDQTVGAPRYRLEASQRFDSKLYAKLASSSGAFKHDTRLLHTSYALAKLLANPASGKVASGYGGVSLNDLAKAVLVHTMLLRHLPVDGRCLVWEQAEAKQKLASEGLNHAALLAELHAHMLDAAVGAGPVPEAEAAAALDVFDGRLLSFVLHTVSGGAGAGVRSLGWSANMEKQLLATWDALKAESGASIGAFLPFQQITSVAEKDVVEREESTLVAEAQAKYEAAKALGGSAVAGGGAKSASGAAAAASASGSTSAPSAAAAKSDEDLGSWEDEDVDETPVAKPAAAAAKPAAAPAKKDEEEDVGSWEDISDEEEEKKEDKPAASSASANSSSSTSATSAAASSSSSSDALSTAASALLPLASLDSKFVRDTCGSLDSLLSSNNLLVPEENKELTPYASAYKVQEGKTLDDGMDDENKPKPPMTRREQRAASRQVNYWEQYSKSLVGGRLVLREVVVAAPATIAEGNEDGDSGDEEKKEDGGKGGKKKPHVKEPKEKKGGGKPGAGGGKGKPGAGGKGKGASGTGELSMKDKIKAQVDEAKRLKEVAKIQGKINVASGLKTLEARIAKLDSELEQVGDASAVPALLLLLEWCLEVWKVAKPKGELQPAVKVFVLIHDIYRRFKQFLTAEEFKKVSLALVQIGFEDTAARLTKEFLSSVGDAKGISADQVKIEQKSSSFPNTLIGLSYNRFQLEYGGPYMLRNVDSAPDDRVTKFYPDRWQRNLLDVADAHQSALIVAPTSAGKTFISYYVMKNVLAANKTAERSKDKGVVVYVSPNKALVNQVSADVYQRYGPVFGTATEDHQDKALTSEVLITVPSVLEKLLLNPGREEWVAKIRWVIFDEVHLISTAGEGSIWERCLSLIRCPFLALSATVGNPRGFYSWLSRLDALRGRQVHLIVHETRWSDLEKGMYLPPNPHVAPHNPDGNAKFDMRTHTILPSQCASVRVHPCAAVGETDFADNKAFPKEVSFSPRDSLSLYDALMKHASSPALTPELKKDLSSLSPDNFFSELLINKARAMEYESRLKRILTSWLEAGLTSEVAQVMSSLTGDLRERIAKMEALSGVTSCYDNDFIRKHFFSLLLELNARDQLPGIVFSNNDELCVQLVTDTLERLEELESKQLETESVSEDSRAKIRAKQQTLKALKKNRDKQMKAKQAEEESRDADQIDLEVEAETDAYVVDPRFSFIEETDKMDKKELDYWVNRTLYKTQWKRSHPLIRALFRGIGVHHSGLVKQYRDLVETLFRGKHLKVVVATSTLALGVNMPARSVTLCGDSKLLTPLQYRQMSGRAGRRGYDNIGHVVFFAVPPRKIFRLLKSPLNSLRGHFPISTTLALKMTDYFTQAADKKDASAALTPLLKEPFFADTYTGAHLIPQIQYYFRFSLDLLHSKGLINNKAAAYGLSTIAQQLGAADPSNYGFVALLESGHLAHVCKRFEQDKNSVARELLSILAHLFFRVPTPAGATKANFRADSNNAILLPPMDPEAKRIIQEYNAHTMDRFTNFVKSFSKLQLHKIPPQVEKASAAAGTKPAPASSSSSAAASSSSAAAEPVEGTPPPRVFDNFFSLPVSGLSYPWVWAGSSVAPNTLMSSLHSSARQFDARSPFVALSGHADEFPSARSLADSVRNGIFLDTKLIPVCMEDLDTRGQALGLNAYVVDFYRNQHFYSIITDNRLSDAFAWGLLKSWSLLLSGITTALRTLSADEANDPVVKSFDHLATTFDHYFGGIITV